jgi:hypothetical protein
MMAKTATIRFRRPYETVTKAKDPVNSLWSLIAVF